MEAEFDTSAEMWYDMRHTDPNIVRSLRPEGEEMSIHGEGFAGWQRPERNFYRLPHSWFDVLAEFRRSTGRRRISGLVRLLEYLIRWTWGQGNFDGFVRLTWDELQNGRVMGRQGGERIRADQGTGLSRSNLSQAIEDALAHGFIERQVTNHKDPARIKHFYRLRLHSGAPPTTPADADEPFAGFPDPLTNYFIVPYVWLDLAAHETSDVLLLATEYLIRHCWGWQRADQVLWLTAEEVAAGRQYHTPEADGSVRRYDNGIDYSVDATRRALDSAVEKGWVVWRYDPDAHRRIRQYTLRRKGWPEGEKSPLNDLTAPPADLSVPLADQTEPANDQSGLGAGDLSVPVSDGSEPQTDLSKPVAALSGRRSDIPTSKNQQTLPTETTTPTPTAAADSLGPALPSDQLRAVEKLLQVGVQPQSTAQTLASSHPAAPIIGWCDYALTEGLGAGYVITMLKAGEPVPRTGESSGQCVPEEEGLLFSRVPSIREETMSRYGIAPETMALWDIVLKELSLQMTKNTFDTWLRGSLLLSTEGGRATIGVRHAYAVDWLQHRLNKVIQRTLARRLDVEAEQLTLSYERLGRPP